MKWFSAYLIGFVLLVAGGLAALWKLGILQNVSPTWIGIGLLILTGIGIMAAVAGGGPKERVEIDRR